MSRGGIYEGPGGEQLHGDGRSVTLYDQDVERKTGMTKENKKLKYVIVRTYSAGVFAGELVKRSGKEVLLKNARRIWYWKGAASLSQLAQSGTSKPMECKFPEAVDSILLTEAIEILDVTPAAKASIDKVPIWKE